MSSDAISTVTTDASLVSQVGAAPAPAATAAVAPGDSGGSSLPVALPQNGTSAPQAAAPSAAQPAVQPLDLSSAIQQINEFIQNNSRNLSFEIDKTSGKTVITVSNPVTGEVVRQIPPQQVLDIARRLRTSGNLLDAYA